MGFLGGDIATAFVVTVLLFAVDGLDFDCRERDAGYYGDPKDCNKYYRCVGPRAFEFSCGEGLHFNDQAKACDWPEQAQCQDDNEGSDTSTGFTPSCFEKPDGTRFRDPEDCAVYYTCASGRLFKDTCRHTLIFSTETDMCDYRQNVDCGVAIIDTDPLNCKYKVAGYTYRDIENCFTYYICVHGRTISMPCAKGTAYDVDLKACNTINKVDCTKKVPSTQSPEIAVGDSITTTVAPGEGGVATTASPGQGGVATTASPPQGGVATTASPGQGGVATTASPGQGGVATTATTITTTKKPWTRPTTKKPEEGDKPTCPRRVCYYTNWSQYRPGSGKFWPEDINPFACTHIIFAFGKVESGKLLNVEWNDRTGWQPGLYERVNNLKKQNTELKTLLAIGGWNHPFKQFSDMSKSRESRRLFVDTTIPYLTENGFDGLDLDWEYPANRGSPPEDKQHFSELVKDLRLGFDRFAQEMGKKPLLVTAAVAAGRATISSAYEISKISKNLDFINLMTYDFHGSWDQKTGHNSPLNGAGGDTNTVQAAVDFWVSNGCPKSKLVVGLALYGHTFKLSGAGNSVGAPTSGPGYAGTFTREAGMMSYYEVCAMESKGKVEWDAVSKVPYLVKGDQWISYDNPQSLREKVRYVRSQGLGGVMCWALDFDDFKGTQCNKGPYPLWSAVMQECVA